EAAANKSFASATKRLAAIRAKKPSGYATLRVSLKALEGPDETNASRRAKYPTVTTGRRTALARAITAPENPLAARVLVNHVWLRLMGAPLVETVTDFGTRCAAPLHQDVLDWLALEFVENGYDLKQLIRCIVTSRVYRRSTVTAEADRETFRRDPSNLYYWRGNSKRLRSQAVRDALLSLSGSLDRRLGGPPVQPNVKVRRRSLYLHHSREGRDPFLELFDDANIFACYRRDETVIPQQALALSNSALSLTMTRRIERRVTRSVGPGADASEFVTAAWRFILSSEPDVREVRECVRALKELEALARKAKDREPSKRSRAALVHALVNHNDFLTVR
ncbi:MAG: DUF1553 domain-containing protein, partial [Planctomycetota bacterium]